MGKIVNSLSVSAIKINNVPINQISNQTASKPVDTESVQVSVNNSSQSPSFKGASAPITLRTTFASQEEQEKYSKVASSLDKNGRKQIDFLLKSGILLSSNSNDKSTTLDNLYKIISTPRAVGLSADIILSETVNTISNPFVITQNFGDIPKKYVPQVIQVAKHNESTAKKPSADKIDERTINVTRSGACVSASIEFNLAKKMPAEFARFANELTSPKLSVDKTIQLENLANNALDAVWLLNAFEIPYQMDNFKSAKLTLAPDKNALIRAQIQTTDKDSLERSVVDVMMQSTFMNVGSQQTYNSLTDNREGKFNDNNKGLIEFEKTFTESIVEDKNKISVTYQIVDENARITGYETDFNNIKKHILQTLSMGENVIIGYTQTDATKKIINGHEITIIGAKQDKNGKLIFICNDTDDDNPNPIEYTEDYIIPKIHHAGLPQEVVEKDMHFVDNWKTTLQDYKAAKNTPQNGQKAA